MSDRIRHIVFDIGNVLIHYDPEIPYRRLIPDHERRRWFLLNVCTSEWNLEQDRGRPWKEAEAILIAQHPEYSEEICAFRKYWHEMVPYAHKRTTALLEGLIDQGSDVTMLTNFSADTFPEACERFPFLNRPRGVTVSGQIGLIKPDTAIYERHARDFDLTPAATIFIDDSYQNVEGARAAGWQAVHFTDAEKLNKDLAEYGISI